MSGNGIGALLTLFFLVILSGALSHLGDVLGYRLGKKRLSLFGLRPRKTAGLITVLTGMFITMITLFAAAMISENVRIFLFRMDEIIEKTEILETQSRLTQMENNRLKEESVMLSRERDELSMQMKRLADERKALNHQMESLSGEISKQMLRISELEEMIESKKSGLIAFTAGQVISYSILEHSFDPEKLESAFEKLFRDIIAIAVQKGARPRRFDDIWEDSRSQRKKITESITSRYEDIPLEQRSDIIVKVICTNNIFKGEGLEHIRLVLEENDVIYPAGTVFRTLVDGTQEREEIAFSLNLFLSFLRERFASDGIISRFEIPPLRFYDTVTSIRNSGQRLMLLISFTEPVTKLGPFEYVLESIPAGAYFQEGPG